MSSFTKLKGLTALITGGAGDLGRATVDRFVREGARVVICDLHSTDGEDLASKSGPDVTFSPGDVSSEQDVMAALSVARDTYGGLDIIVNCHGVAVSALIANLNRDSSHDFDQFNRVQRVNLTGAFNTIRLAAQMMSENTPNEDGQRGVIVNAGSVSAFEGMRTQSAYSASQGGITGMTLPIARDLARCGIRINTIALGFFMTSLISSKLPQKVEDYLKWNTPFPKRLGKADEFAHAVQFLVENPMMNGTTFRLDGASRMFYF